MKNTQIDETYVVDQYGNHQVGLNPIITVHIGSAANNFHCMVNGQLYGPADLEERKKFHDLFSQG
jgi:hypothetical protein